MIIGWRRRPPPADVRESERLLANIRALAAVALKRAAVAQERITALKEADRHA